MRPAVDGDGGHVALGEETSGPQYAREVAADVALVGLDLQPEQGLAGGTQRGARVCRRGHQRHVHHVHHDGLRRSPRRGHRHGEGQGHEGPLVRGYDPH